MSSTVDLREEAELERTAMTEKELRRVGVMTRVEAGELRLVDAAELLRLSYRQASRVWARYRAEGPPGLQHRNAGRPSNHSKPRSFRKKVLKLVGEKYSGEEGVRFGPTLAAEHLAADDGQKVDHETLRRWMLEAGLWSLGRQRKQHRQRRERKAHFGELVQMDGSFHGWLDASAGRQCLMNMVDDATSTVLAELHEQETIWAAVEVLRAWIEKYGVPHLLYPDWKNVYLRAPTAEERVSGREALTQFGRMCQRLGIRIIGASSPQAKGRVERSNGTFQDRLVKKLRLRGIHTREAANRYLRQHYLPDHNRRFSRAAASPEDYHRAAPGKAELDAIFRMEQGRIISNDWVVQYEGRFLQIERESRYAPAGGTVVVSEGRGGDLQVWYRDGPVKWHEIARPGPQPATRRQVKGHAAEIRKKLHRPGPSHPWKQWVPSPHQRQTVEWAVRAAL